MKLVTYHWSGKHKEVYSKGLGLVKVFRMVLKDGGAEYSATNELKWNHEHPSTKSDKPTHHPSDQTDNRTHKKPNHNRPLSANSFMPQVFCHPFAGNSGK